MNLFFFCCPYKRRQESRNDKEQAIYLIPWALEEKQQFAVVLQLAVILRCGMEKYGFLENKRQESIMMMTLLQSPLNLCAWAFITSPSQSPMRCNNYSNWLSSVSPEMAEFPRYNLFA